MKKMYNKPITEVLSVNTERMMSDINVSINGGSGNEHPQAGAPAHRGGDVIE